jgi:hypothetical protein
MERKDSFRSHKSLPSNVTAEWLPYFVCPSRAEISVWTSAALSGAFHFLFILLSVC